MKKKKHTFQASSVSEHQKGKSSLGCQNDRPSELPSREGSDVPCLPKEDFVSSRSRTPLTQETTSCVLRDGDH